MKPLIRWLRVSTSWFSISWLNVVHIRGVGSGPMSENRKSLTKEVTEMIEDRNEEETTADNYEGRSFYSAAPTLLEIFKSSSISTCRLINFAISSPSANSSVMSNILSATMASYKILPNEGLLRGFLISSCLISC